MTEVYCCKASCCASDSWLISTSGLAIVESLSWDELILYCVGISREQTSVQNLNSKFKRRAVCLGIMRRLTQRSSLPIKPHSGMKAPIFRNASMGHSAFLLGLLAPRNSWSVSKSFEDICPGHHSPWICESS